MSKKTRYFIIFLCFVFFMIASPIIVLYVKGIAFDLEKKIFYKTGTLGIKSNPKKVNIFLDGKLAKTSEGNLRFLKPKEYLVEISKDNYQTWSKRLNVGSGLVTWANPGNNKVNLFLKQPKNLFSTNNISSLIQIDNKIFYTQNGFLVEQNLDQVIEKFTHELPKKYEKSTIAYKIDNSDILALTYNETKPPNLLYDLNSKLFITTENLVGTDADLKYYKNGVLFFLEKNKLYEIDYKKNSKKMVAENIIDCLFTENNFYALKKDSEGSALFAGSKPGSEESKITTGLSNAVKTKIFVDFQKHVFVQLDNNLYRISSKPELIAENLKELHFDEKRGGFVYIIGSEFYWQNSSTLEPKFIHRSSMPLTSPSFIPEINYSFINKNGQLSALELDLRDKQNEFPIFSAPDIKKYAISEDGKNAGILYGDNLVILEIR